MALETETGAGSSRQDLVQDSTDRTQSKVLQTELGPGSCRKGLSVIGVEGSEVVWKVLEVQQADRTWSRIL